MTRGTAALTGATGFIGKRIATRLQESGWQVRALVRNRARGRRLPAGIEAVTGSLEDRASLEDLVTGCDAIVHCAGVVRGSTYEDFARVNVAGTARLVDATLDSAPAARFLLISSLAAREPHLSHYAASKRAGEDVLREHSSGSLSWTVIRPPAVYGPGDTEMLPLFSLMARGIAPVFGPGDARFSLVFVDDLADAVQTWCTGNAGHRQVYELHDGKPGGYGWKEVTAIVAEHTGRRVRQIRVPAPVLSAPAAINWLGGRLLRYSPMLTPGKLRELRHPDWTCDNTGISAELGWQPKIRLEEGLRLTPGWWDPS